MLAAGAICWRPGATGELELLLVESARWGDWSWPKGKLDPGESLPECAVREVAEETGVRIELGVPLPTVSYVLPDGRDKTVLYWAARVRDEGERTAGPDEIARIAWLPVAQALDRLTRPGDLAPVQALLDLHAGGRLDTRPVLVLRHAKARSRAHWSGSEADRPLTRTGRRQAEGLVRLLPCWAPDRVLSSPWARCVQTLQLFLDGLDHAGAGSREAVELLPLLSEDGLHDEPARIGALLAELLDSRAPVLVCTHRPVLRAAVRALTRVADESARDELPDGDPWLSPAEVLVLHVRRPPSRSDLNVTTRIQSVERYRGESARNIQR